VTVVRAILHEQEIRDVLDLPGEGELVIEGVAPLDAVEDRCLCFVNGEVTAGIRESLSRHRGCIVIAPEGSTLDGELDGSRALEVGDPRAAIAKVLDLIRTLGRQPPWIGGREIAESAEISPLAIVEGDVAIGDGVRIGPFCIVGPDVSIGAGTVLSAGVQVYPRVSIGECCAFGPRTVLGIEGTGFVREEAGDKKRMTHLAGLVIGSHVETGTTAGIQAGVLTPTIVEDHAKLDGLVGIGHGARIGRGATLIGGVMVGGSAVVGADAWIGMNSTVRQGRRVGERARVGMNVAVQDDLPDDAIARAPRPDITSGPR
jgi:UDP-3-O-[3-hydroxymyristoyl] glucosamine N-acyltransferase